MSKEILSTIPVAEDQARVDQFLNEEVQQLGSLYSLPSITFKVGNKWSTNLETGEVTIDLSFFTDKGYKPDWVIYGALHEIRAHLSEVLLKPGFTKRVIEFINEGEAQSIFHNIFADIAGNKAIHARLPRMSQVAEDLYRHKLMPDDPTPQEDFLEVQKRYIDEPRHLQFLYKIIRDEMIPGSHTGVAPEVREAIDSLRNFEDSGEDMIKFSTALSDPSGHELSPEVRFEIWIQKIYPIYQKLLEQDQQDPHFQQNQSVSTNSQGQPADQPNKSENNQSTCEEDQIPSQFDQYYKDYHENRHPEPMPEKMKNKLHETVGQVIKEKERQERIKRYETPERSRDKQLLREVGHSLQELRAYNEELSKYQSEIDAFRNIYKQVIDQRLSMKRGLSRQATPTGVLLDPNRLAQTVVDIKSGIQEPVAYLGYTERKRSMETVGNVDYYFVIDTSTSMAEGDGEKAKAATATAMIFLEGLSAMQADVEREEMNSSVNLDLMIRSSVYVFGENTKCIKPLSTSLNVKQRMDTYATVSRPAGGTPDYVALQAIADEQREDSDRRRIIIVMSDGESDNKDEAIKALNRLRAQPNTFVFGISIGSDDAVELYKPHSQRVDNPRDLPEKMRRLISGTIV